MLCHWIILDSTIICIALIKMSLRKDTADTQKSASYLDLHLEIDNTTGENKQNSTTNVIFNFPFISSNIPASPAFGVYISQLIRYSRACDQYSDFLDRAHQLTQKLPKQDYVAAKLKPSLQKFYSRQHDLVSLTIYPYLKWQCLFFIFYIDVSFLLINYFQDLYQTWLYTSNTTDIL